MPQYPLILPGLDISAELLNAMHPTFAFKPNHTDRASTTTFTADPDLVLPLAGSAVYRVEAWLNYGAGSTGDFKTSWQVPSGATGNRGVLGPGSTASDGGADNITARFGVHNFGTTVNYNGVRNSTGNMAFALETATIWTTSAGDISLLWAQNTSDATATRLGAGSYMTARRLA
ncbi:hypothetical protein [Streptomyces bacillaris]|uniref:hypothetical protein n=1 Tax=Streptomyces bacillaris TaxID=68179 RepID=UPI00364BAD1F